MRTDLIATKTTAVAATLSAIETRAMAVVRGLRLKRRNASRMLLTVLISSLVPQRHHRIDLCGAASWNIGCDDCHNKETKYGSDQGRWIAGLDVKQECAHRALGW